MKRIYKIQENIPNFQAKITGNQIVINFDKKIGISLLSAKDISGLEINHNGENIDANIVTDKSKTNIFKLNINGGNERARERR